MPVFVPDLISDVELAKRWNISPRWEQDRFRSGEFPGRKISRKWFVTEDDIAEILKRIAIPVKDAKIARVALSAEAPQTSSMTKTTARRLGQGCGVMMRDPLEIPDPFENGIWPSCKSFDVLYPLDPTVFIPRRSRHCMDDVGNQALRCRPVPLVSEVGRGRTIPDQFLAGFCPTCSTFDPVFGVYRIAGDQCTDPHHEPTEVSE